jgi:hypothetical protein
MWNLVKVTGDIRAVQETQNIYSFVVDTNNPISVSGGNTESHFFQFTDPIVSIETITDYTFNSAVDGTGTDLTSSVSVSSTDLFAKTVKITFTNASATKAYLTELKIDGDPAIVVRGINEELKNTISIGNYDEKRLEITNDFVQTESNAESIGNTILYYFSNYGQVVDLTVKGNPALQIGDCVTLDIDYFKGSYTIIKIVNSYSETEYIQRLQVRKNNLLSQFTLDVSILNGDDVLTP